MPPEIRSLPNTLTAMVGSNFSGRSAALHAWAEKGDGIYLPGSTTSAVSGLQASVGEELRFYCKGDADLFARVTRLAGDLGLKEIWQQNPFAGECSGGQEAALVILCRLALGRKVLGLDVCIEQLSLERRRLLYGSVLMEFGQTQVRVVDNRLAELFPDVTGDSTISRAHNWRHISSAHRFPGTRKLGLRKVTFGYRKNRTVLRDVSAEFAPGIHHLQGPNGAGKSTLAKICAGLLRPLSGEIVFGDERVDLYRQPGQVTAFAFQDPNLQLFATKMPDTSGDPLYAAFGLAASVGTHPLDLPWVLRKRLSVALALLRPTPVVVLDEPTLGQDDSFCHGLAQILKSHADAGRIIIVISHSTSFAQRIGASAVALGQLNHTP